MLVRELNLEKAENLNVPFTDLIKSDQAEIAIPMGVAALHSALEYFSAGKILGVTTPAFSRPVLQAFSKNMLKKLAYNKYYEHVQHIINKVSGIPPPKMTREVEEKFRQMFKQCQEPFTTFCPKNRKNFLSYSYTLHKFCELLEIYDFLPCFPLLKSQDKLKEQDRIWKKICKSLDWDYIPSI